MRRGFKVPSACSRREGVVRVPERVPIEMWLDSELRKTTGLVPRRVRLVVDPHRL